MGVLLSKFLKEKTPFELLEQLDNQITSLNTVKANTMVWQKKVLGLLITYSTVLYIILALVVYCKLFPAAVTRWEQFMLILPFLVFPGLVWGINKFLTWWYHRKVMRDDMKMELLKEKKAKLLEEVMEKETYKVAMQILDRFGKSQARSPAADITKGVSKESAAAVQGTHGEVGNLRRRAGRQACLNTSLPVTTRRTAKPSKLNTTLGTICSPTGKSAGASDHPPHSPLPLVAGGVHALSAPVPALPRPILARDRGYLDKFVEFLVGDGPANRYALICSQCQAHNGMALREEFLFLAYRCCYCYYWNPARKQRPVAPRLPVQQPGSSSSLSSDVSSVQSVQQPCSSSSLSSDVSSVQSAPQFCGKENDVGGKVVNEAGKVLKNQDGC